MKIPQPQQSLRIIPPNPPIRINTPHSLLNRLRIIIPPPTPILNPLIRIINTKQHPIRPDLLNNILQRPCREMPTRRNPDILLKIVIDTLLTHNIPRLLRNGFLHILEPVVYPPEVERDVFAVMADDHFCRGEAVEDTVCDEAESV